MAKARVSKILLKWHKRLGVTSAVFVLLLALTGALLNHSNFFGLDQSYLNAPMAERLYGIKPAPIFVSELLFEHTSKTIVAVASSIYIEDKFIQTCQGEFVGALALNEIWVLACEGELKLLTVENEVIDVFKAQFEFNAKLSAIAKCEDTVCLKTEQGRFQLDETTLQFLPSNAEAIWQVKVPAKAETRSRFSESVSVISWERLVQDLHAGRFLGSFGPWLMDIIALLFIILSVTGLLIWMKKDLKSRRKSKRKAGHK